MKKLFIFLLSALTFCYAKDYKIEDTIKDISNGEPLPFANVSVKGNARGMSSDINGRFELPLYEVYLSVSIRKLYP